VEYLGRMIMRQPNLSTSHTQDKATLNHRNGKLNVLRIRSDTARFSMLTWLGLLGYP
jgi:hypothetical protein